MSIEMCVFSEYFAYFHLMASDCVQAVSAALDGHFLRTTLTPQISLG